MNEKAELKTLHDVLTEKELLDLLGMKRGALDRLRCKGLPYCPVSLTCRIYLVKDVLEFISQKRMIRQV